MSLPFFKVASVPFGLLGKVLLPFAGNRVTSHVLKEKAMYEPINSLLLLVSE